MRINMISEDRYNIVKLSPHMFLSWMYILKGAQAYHGTYSFEGQCKWIKVFM